MSKEAMKLALEAAYLAGWNASGEGYNSEYPFGDHARNPEEDAAWIKDRDNALREALAEQPAQQKPVAWGIIASNTGRICQVELDADEIEGHNPKYIVPLYTSPPASKPWVGLTDQEIEDLWNHHEPRFDFYSFSCDIEAKLKEKNA